jgi:uncharacterized metal-binding protein YceD (DUF177 family)
MPDRPAPPPSPLTHPLRVRHLPARRATRFDLLPDEALRAALARHAGLAGLPFLRFRGEVAPLGRSDMALRATLEAVVVQPCSVTLAPVTTRLSERVERRYLADYSEPQGEEVELDAEDEGEPLPEVIDAGHVATEALILALPLYPRAAGAQLGQVAFAPPGAAPLPDEGPRPFEGLAALRATLAPGRSDPGSGGE